MGVTILITLRWISVLDVWCSFMEYYFCSHSWASCFLCWKKWWKLIDLMPCVRLSPSTYTIAEFNPKHITHSGDLLSLFLHPFSACGLELIQQMLRNRVFNKNRYVYPLYMHISWWTLGDMHTCDFWSLISFQCKLGWRNYLSLLWGLRSNVRTRSLRYNGINAINWFLVGSMKD